MQGCLFCRMADHEIKTDVVLENDTVFAFRDINPQAPVHVLIIPRKHIASVNDIIAQDSQIMGDIMLAAKAIAKKEGCLEKGYRLVVNTGPDSGQAVDHLHFHLLAGRKLGWPPG